MAILPLASVLHLYFSALADVAVFLNRRARGAASAAGEDLCARFAARGLAAEVVTPTEGDDFRQVICGRVKSARMAVAAGGDGTVNAVASAIAGTSTALGVIPLGTLNHFAKDLDIPMDVEKAIDVIAAGRTVSVDVGAVNDLVFVNNSSIGVYPTLVDTRTDLQARGHWKWPSFLVAALHVLSTQQRVLATVDAQGHVEQWLTPFVLVGNNAYGVHGWQLAGRTRIDAGRLFAYAAPRARVRDLPVVLFREWFRRAFHRATQAGELRSISGPELTVDLRGPREVDVAVDGESVRLTQPLRFQCRPKALRVIVPGR